MSKIFGKQIADKKQIELYNQFIALDAKEEAILADLAGRLDNKEFDQVTKEISKLSNKLIFKLCENDKSMKSFCDVKLPRHNYHIKVWQNFLDTNFLHLGRNFLSLDKKIVHTIFHQFVSSYLLAEFKKLQAADEEVLLQEKLLNEMCAMDYFYGLIERAKLIVKKLANKTTETDRTNYLGQFKLDIANLCNVYADVGYTYAAKLSLDLAAVFADETFSGAKTLSKHFYQDGIQKFYAGKFLYERRPPKHNYFTYANGRGNVLDMVFDRLTWEDAEKEATAYFVDKPALLNELKDSGEKEVKKILEKYPRNF